MDMFDKIEIMEERREKVKLGAVMHGLMPSMTAGSLLLESESNY